MAEVEQDPTPAITLQELRNSASLLEREAVATARATEEQCDARRPGSAKYPDETPQAWFAYACWLSGLGAERAAIAAAGGRSLERVLHDALADTPAPVTLASGKEIAIYAKSLNTLCILEGLDADLQQVLNECETLRADLAADDVDRGVAASTLFIGALLKGRALRFYVWILAHEGPGLPFSETDSEPAPPAWTAEITGTDLEAIVRAHLQVNRRDLDFLTQAFPTETRGTSSRLPLSGFLGGYANEIGEQPSVLMRRWSLRSLFAGGIVRATSLKEAHAAAEAARR
jgi:hypothetical protein